MARTNKKRNGRVIRIQDEQQHQAPKKHTVKLIPRNTAQEDYILNLHNPSNRIVFAIGPAGTGKTYLAVQKAIAELREQRVARIVITRPAVTAGEDHGFLPGDLNRKMEPWTRPIFDVFEEYYTPKDIKAMVEDNVIEICPLAYMRGRTFKDAVVIFDESQNTKPGQMKMALTRIGEGSRMFITGDLGQSDFKGDNGLRDFFARMAGRESGMIAMTEFSREHVERDPIVEEVLKYYGEDD